MARQGDSAQRSPHREGHALLRLDPWIDRDRIRVVVETPKDSKVKLKFDEASGLLELSHVLPAGMVFPFDFGFVPGTRADDGDPLDILLLLEAPVPPGSVVPARLIGVIEAEQREKDGAWERNDRVLAVAADSALHRDADSVDDVTPALLEEIEAFFQNYDRLAGKEFRPIGRRGSKRAREAVEKAQAKLDD